MDQEALDREIMKRDYERSIYDECDREDQEGYNIMNFTITDYETELCELYKTVGPPPGAVMIGYLFGRNMDPCTTGCAWYEGGKCPGFKMLEKRRAAHQDNVKRITSVEPTNAELAQKMGITKRQVSKLKKEGKL